jgi:hypothetical protein
VLPDHWSPLPTSNVRQDSFDDHQAERQVFHFAVSLRFPHSPKLPQQAFGSIRGTSSLGPCRPRASPRLLRIPGPFNRKRFMVAIPPFYSQRCDFRKTIQ